MENTHTQRESMVFYKSFFEAIEDLPGEEFKKCACAILNYGLNGELPETKGFEKAIMTLVKPQIDKNNQRWTNAKKSHSKKTSEAEEQNAEKKENEVHKEQNAEKKENEVHKQPFDKESCGEYENVFLTQAEMIILKRNYGEKQFNDSVEFLSRYIKRKPDYKSASHYEDIRSWVQEAVQRQKKNAVKPINPSFDFDFEDLYEKP